jgi:hypothetical protein
MVACEGEAVRLDSSGKALMTYPEEGAFLFALNLDPDGTTFWTGGLGNGEIYHFNIATGELVGQFSSSPSTSLAGLAVVGEIVAAQPSIVLAPATGTAPVGTTHTLTATVTEEGAPKSGVTVTFKVSGANAQTGTATTNGAGEASFTYTGVNVGADTIVASFEDKAKATIESNSAEQVWTEGGTTCSRAEGEVVYLLLNERQRLSDKLSTNLAVKPQHFHFSWLNGAKYVDLTALKKASCTVSSTGSKKFVGSGPATLNGVPGYTLKFTIGVSSKGANSVVVHILEGKEKIASFHDSAKTGEVIA